MRFRIGILLVVCQIGASRALTQQSPNDTHYRKLTPTAISEVLDGVIDIAADSSGHIVIADGKRGALLLLDERLNAIGQIGRKGSGPGEYREIQAVRGTKAGFIAVDRVLRRIYVYAWRRGAPLLERSVSLDFEPYDACPRLDGKILVLGRRQGKRLHLVDAVSGKVTASGAPFPQTVSVALSDNLIEGRISCGGNKEIVALTSSWIPVFDLVSISDLKIVHTDTIKPVRVLDIKDDRKRLTFSSGPQGYHAPGRALFAFGQWIIQARTVARTDQVEDDSVMYFARKPDGRPISNWTRSDRIFPISRDTAIAVVEGLTVDVRKIRIADALAHRLVKAK